MQVNITNLLIKKRKWNQIKCFAKKKKPHKIKKKD